MKCDIHAVRPKSHSSIHGCEFTIRSVKACPPTSAMSTSKCGRDARSPFGALFSLSVPWIPPCPRIRLTNNQIPSFDRATNFGDSDCGFQLAVHLL